MALPSCVFKGGIDGSVFRALSPAPPITTAPSLQILFAL